MISYKTNARKALLPKEPIENPRSLTAELAELSLLREKIRLAEARIQQRRCSMLFAPPRRAPRS